MSKLTRAFRESNRNFAVQKKKKLALLRALSH
ncbi:hypothetical protein Rmet_6472 [Cupriavidus metallidurans CH34]|uniref:Uncharacterized protein n=1 Tax=Cupriavidus metallidurans (strain ATCC 43123 / DSM 2839 / NBRC 102507 / CH34) TaxID=266264 RepID=D3DXR2_CUPMC|nr:hypothetical protein Rmet_6472 [Cupriavidus metallidurans CH34]